MNKISQDNTRSNIGIDLNKNNTFGIHANFKKYLRKNLAANVRCKFFFENIPKLTEMNDISDVKALSKIKFKLKEKIGENFYTIV